jgi:hypothetical protein
MPSLEEGQRPDDVSLPLLLPEGIGRNAKSLKEMVGGYGFEPQTLSV